MATRRTRKATTAPRKTHQEAPLRVLVCGGRDYADYDTLKTVLSALQVVRGSFAVIIHGAAEGADRLADQYADRHSIPILRFHADWRRHGRAAGPLRNRRMLVEGKPDFVVAFPGGGGTANMMRQAREAGVEVINVAGTGKQRAA